jgi:hypothetical protein
MEKKMSEEQFIKDVGATLAGVMDWAMTQAERDIAERLVEYGEMEWVETENGNRLEWIR